MRVEASPNSDRCGRCRRYHIRLVGARAFRGGNDHSCRVHGPVSPGCCPQSCDPDEWRFEYEVGPVPLVAIDPATEITPLGGEAIWRAFEKPTPHTTHVLHLAGEDAGILVHERSAGSFWCVHCNRTWEGTRDDAVDHARQPHQVSTTRGMTGAELRTRRLVLGLTQAQLAEELGTDQSTISRWEEDQIQMRRESLIIKALAMLEQTR